MTINGDQLMALLNTPMTKAEVEEAVSSGDPIHNSWLEYHGIAGSIREGIIKGVKAVYRKGDTIEIRAWDKEQNRYVGRYRYGNALIDALVMLDESDCDCYFVLNPTTLEPVTVQRYIRGTQEPDVAHRRFFLLDFDPLRQQKIATDEQKAAAHSMAAIAYNWLKEQGWEGVVAACSGNGIHLLVPIDLPNTEEAKKLVQKTQRAISKRFSTDEVECECFPDAARLVRAYGTLNKKGAETETLKYHRSGVLSW